MTPDEIASFLESPSGVQAVEVMWQADRRAFAALASEEACYRAMLRALLATPVGGTTCETCGGSGRALQHIIGPGRERIYGQCADCDGSGSVAGAPAVVPRSELVQVGWMGVDNETGGRPLLTSADFDEMEATWIDAWLPVYRLGGNP